MHNLKDVPEVDLSANPRVRKTDIDKNATVQKLIVTQDFLKIQCPARIFICGPSTCGKSHFMLNLIEHRDVVFNKKIDFINIFFPPNSIGDYHTFMSHVRAAAPDIPIQVREGIPAEGEVINKHGAHQLYIFDDLMDQFFSSDVMKTLIISDSHHKNLSVMVTTQNYFSPEKHRITILRSCSIQVIFKDKTDRSTTRNISSRLTGDSEMFPQIFEWLRLHPEVSECSKYIVVETSQSSELNESMSIRTKIFPSKEGGGVAPIFFLR